MSGHGLSFGARVLPVALAMLALHSLPAVEILTREGVALNQSVGDDLHGIVGQMSAPLHSTSWGGSENAAAFTDATSASQPSRNVFWHPDGVAYHITWDLGVEIHPAQRQLDSVSIWIDAHDPGRKGFRGSLATSIDGTHFIEIPGTLYQDPLVQAGTGPSPLFNNVTYSFNPGEVVGFRYMRLNSFDDVSSNLLQPRYVEVDAFTSRVPGPSSRPPFWAIRDGRFFVDDQWVFLKTGKLLRSFGSGAYTDQIIAEIDVMIDQLNYNHLSLNIYPDQFDTTADGRVDPGRRAGMEGIKRILDHCWARGVFCSLSFETYNVGGGGVPAKLFQLYPEIHARNALLELARDVEYGGAQGKYIPSIHHPRYLKWSRDFIRNFLRDIGDERVSQLLYVETTVEPQYLGRNHVDSDQRRAALDYSEAAREAFETWREALPANDPRRDFHWPTTQLQRDNSIGNEVFNEFRGEALGRWVTGDIEAIRSVVSDVYVAVDYNGRFDDPNLLRVGHPDAFLREIIGANVIQIAPHWVQVWSSKSWDDVIRINQRENKGWAISEHMTANGGFPTNDSTMASILDGTLQRGTRWGWDFVNVANNYPNDAFHLYYPDWTSAVLDIIEGENWATWLDKIGAAAFEPYPRSQPAHFAIWQQRHFSPAERESDGITGPAADPYGTGVTNLMRYALGVNPGEPGPAALPRLEAEMTGATAPGLVLHYTRNRMARDIEFSVLVSEDLLTWEPVPDENIIERRIEGEKETVFVPVPLTPDQASRSFVRLKVKLQE
jgi:hypothetical protein